MGRSLSAKVAYGMKFGEGSPVSGVDVFNKAEDEVGGVYDYDTFIQYRIAEEHDIPWIPFPDNYPSRVDFCTEKAYEEAKEKFNNKPIMKRRSKARDQIRTIRKEMDVKFDYYGVGDYVRYLAVIKDAGAGTTGWAGNIDNPDEVFNLPENPNQKIYEFLDFLRIPRKRQKYDGTEEEREIGWFLCGLYI